LEIGAGLGSLTVALAEAGAERVVAVEFDRALLPALQEAVAVLRAVSVVHADATKLDWSKVLADDEWIVCGNLPYNVGTTITLDALERPEASRIVVMLQREVGERLVATPGSPRRDAYGAVSLRVAYRAHARIVRHVPREVFWPRPKVGSVVVSLERRERPAVEVDEGDLWRLVDEAFAERRKTMRNALRRLGLTGEEADEVLANNGLDPGVRPEELDLDRFAAIARGLNG
jgi:16S rRNA (adenine1518-N6/adenine1519-N6)-dimethyltransferase